MHFKKKKEGVHKQIQINKKKDSWDIVRLIFPYCRTLKKISLMCVFGIKFLLYIVLVFRLHLAFGESIFAEEAKRVFQCIYGLMVCYLIFTFTATAFVISGKVHHITPHMRLCALEPMPIWGQAVYVVFDTSISLLCLYAFDSPLRQLLRGAASNSKGEKLKNTLNVFMLKTLFLDIVELLRKYYVLTLFAVFSTILIQLVFLFDIDEFLVFQKLPSLVLDLPSFDKDEKTIVDGDINGAVESGYTKKGDNSNVIFAPSDYENKTVEEPNRVDIASIEMSQKQ
ncbi:hypothetical protein RFI_25414 [Reticulomyxa filosa]|uniref:Uncharacterized protein n=1 Tax=Reticulomyxa filosa TaxID=46433 RepID=X6MD75_RETFI|nr:hypothetical protein RFI_25414 [Reticulomyxa filosa]|eukprot:ETO11963.1 hypothetical protein RFI_25414 [Reticulomyxa filosa]